MNDASTSPFHTRSLRISDAEKDAIPPNGFHAVDQEHIHETMRGLLDQIDKQMHPAPSQQPFTNNLMNDDAFLPVTDTNSDLLDDALASLDDDPHSMVILPAVVSKVPDRAPTSK